MYGTATYWWHQSCSQTSSADPACHCYTAAAPAGAPAFAIPQQQVSPLVKQEWLPQQQAMHQTVTRPIFSSATFGSITTLLAEIVEANKAPAHDVAMLSSASQREQDAAGALLQLPGHQR